MRREERGERREERRGEERISDGINVKGTERRVAYLASIRKRRRQVRAGAK